uniref:Uncharacterized protein n=1 Tax=Zea mays TaxID=4577 RepID=B4FM62_MAIZE|nr:unknown [Zea mays]
MSCKMSFGCKLD